MNPENLPNDLFNKEKEDSCMEISLECCLQRYMKDKITELCNKEFIKAVDESVKSFLDDNYIDLMDAIARKVINDFRESFEIGIRTKK